MSVARPVVSVYATEDASKASTLAAPAVFNSPLRPDLVDFVTSQMQLNTRQAYAVSLNAGYQTAAESWGTGRAVSRIPRVPGGGTHRSGQGAFGNMCRGGGMFAPTKTWRKWHRKINLTQRRHALASAVAATAVPALVMARGHRIGEVPELPLVVDNEAESIKKTKDAHALLKRIGLEEELKAVILSKKVRVGRGKIRNRRYVQKKGPLVVYNEDDGIVKSFRNIPGVETCPVNRLHLCKVAPGGHLGRMVVYTAGAFKQLTNQFGTGRGPAAEKKGYYLPRPIMTNTDLHRIINSDEVQSVLRPMKEGGKKFVLKKNPFKNQIAMDTLNPGATHRKLLRKKLTEKGSREYETLQRKKAKRKALAKSRKPIARTFFRNLKAAYTVSDVVEEPSADGDDE